MPDDLHSMDAWLREQRHEPSALDLDRIKLRAIDQAARHARSKGVFVRKRSTLAAILAAGVLATGTGAFAVSGGFSGSNEQSISASQYQSCKRLQRENRAEEKALARQNRVEERNARRAGVRGKAYSRLVRGNRAEEKALRKRNRREEKRCRKNQF